jgi:GDP-L-fucose synthase
MTKNILVAGSERGFLSGNLIRRLQAAGYNTECCSSINYDLEWFSDVEDWIFKSHKNLGGIDTFIACAAKCGGIGANMTSPADFFSANIHIGINLIEGLSYYTKEYNSSLQYINIGTTCSYPSETPVPFKEEWLGCGEPEKTNSAYAWSKFAIMKMGQAYKQQYNLNFSTLILSNIYGINDSFNDNKSHVIPAIIKKVVEAKAANANSIRLFGDGTPTRDFLYVEDACQAIIAAIESRSDYDIVNVGSGQEYSIKETAETICKLLDYKGTIEFDPTKPNGQNRRCLDISKAKTLLNWSPKTTIEEGLKKTILWYLTK